MCLTVHSRNQVECEGREGSETVRPATGTLKASKEPNCGVLSLAAYRNATVMATLKVSSDLADEAHDVQARPVADKSPWLLSEIHPIPGFLSRCHTSYQGPMYVRDTVVSVHTEACSGCPLTGLCFRVLSHILCRWPRDICAI